MRYPRLEDVPNMALVFSPAGSKKELFRFPSRPLSYVRILGQQAHVEQRLDTSPAIMRLLARSLLDGVGHSNRVGPECGDPSRGPARPNPR